MVRSHIGNVVCRKALCVRVASSPPCRSKGNFAPAFFIPETGPPPRSLRGKGALSKNKLAEWAVLEYHREKWKSSKEQRV